MAYAAFSYFIGTILYGDDDYQAYQIAPAKSFRLLLSKEDIAGNMLFR